MSQLQELISQGESETLEFKRSFGAETIESLGAFANADGGAVLVGIEDDATVHGVTVGKKTIEDWANQIREATDPRLLPSIILSKIDGRTCAVIAIAKGVGAPVSVRGIFLRRVGRSNQRMSHAEIMQRLWATSGLSWDAGTLGLNGVCHWKISTWSRFETTSTKLRELVEGQFPRGQPKSSFWRG